MGDHDPAAVPPEHPAVAVDPAAAASTTKLKTIEEYRLSLHDKLLDARKEATDFINTYIIACYGFLGILILLLTRSLTKLSVAGVDIPINQTYAPEYIVLLVVLAYILIDFHVLRLARIFRAITRSSVEISKINPSARVVGVEDMNLFVSGLSGVMLAPARSQTRWLISNIGRIPIYLIQDFVGLVIGLRRSHSTWRLINATFRFFSNSLFTIFSVSGAQLGLRVISASFVIYFPIIAAIGTLLYVKYPGIPYPNFSDYVTRIDPFDMLLTCVAALNLLYTGWAWFSLCLSYSLDEFISLINDFQKSIEDLRTELGIPTTVSLPEVARLREIIQNW